MQESGHPRQGDFMEQRTEDGGFEEQPVPLRRPSSVEIHFRTPITVPTMTAMTKSAHKLVRIDDTLIKHQRRKGEFAAKFG